MNTRSLGGTSLALIVSLAVNAGALTFLEWSVRDSNAPPEGQVTIMQVLPSEELVAQAHLPVLVVRP